jgi:hypothetical protein
LLKTVVKALANESFNRTKSSIPSRISKTLIHAILRNHAKSGSLQVAVPGAEQVTNERALKMSQVLMVDEMASPTAATSFKNQSITRSKKIKFHYPE